MRTIYLDKEFKCHVQNDGTMTAVETEEFAGKCDAYVEGYCYDNREGVRVYPWKPLVILEAFQQQYERDAAEREDMVAALNEMEVYA